MASANAPVQYPSNYSVVWSDEGEDRHVLKTPVPAHQAIRFPWVPDLGDGRYQNPVICADYSDPDVCRGGGEGGDDFYMTASSFSCVPGLPILRSRDLVNWTLIGHAFDRYIPDFDIPRHGCGVWAPAIRFHEGHFYIFWGDPDNGIFMVRSRVPNGPPTEWEPIHLVRRAKGWIDTCPFWDEDGNAYMVNAFSRMRAGFRNVLHLHRMSPDGRELLDDGVEIVSGHGNYTVVEGPKMYKRNGFYYILAPGGGVAQGYQIAFRARNIFGPYESRIVMDRGSTPVNGPHQGGWVNTSDGKEDWFVHFQEVLPYGRVVHLQPMRWENDWPVIGDDARGTGRGAPVAVHRKPAVKAAGGPAAEMAAVPQTSDEFDGAALGPQWQWWANSEAAWFSLTVRPGFLRLFPVPPHPTAPDQLFYNRPNLLLQKFPAEVFMVTAKLDLSGLGPDESAGLVLAGKTISALECRIAEPPQGEEESGASLLITRTDWRFDDPNFPVDLPTAAITLRGTTVHLRMRVEAGGMCTFFYSADGKKFAALGNAVKAINAMWIGAKVGLFANCPAGTAAKGHADIDWFRFEA